MKWKENWHNIKSILCLRKRDFACNGKKSIRAILANSLQGVNKISNSESWSPGNIRRLSCRMINTRRPLARMRNCQKPFQNFRVNWNRFWRRRARQRRDLQRWQIWSEGWKESSMREDAVQMPKNKSMSLGSVWESLPKEKLREFSS